MKKVLIGFVALLMSFGTFDANASVCKVSVESVNSITIPVNIVVKQVVTFKDGTKVTVFYKKEGDVCKLYSNTDVTKYKESDLDNIVSTSFEVTDRVEGKCYLTRKVSNVIELAKSLFERK